MRVYFLLKQTIYIYIYIYIYQDTTTPPHYEARAVAPPASTIILPQLHGTRDATPVACPKAVVLYGTTQYAFGRKL